MRSKQVEQYNIEYDIINFYCNSPIFLHDLTGRPDYVVTVSTGLGSIKSQRLLVWAV